MFGSQSPALAYSCACLLIDPGHSGNGHIHNTVFITAFVYQDDVSAATG
jgi:hypothetical protein